MKKSKCKQSRPATSQGGIFKAWKTSGVLLWFMACLLATACDNEDRRKEDPSETAPHRRYRLATYNIRRIARADTGNRAWSVRRPLVKTMVTRYNFDIFGIQEPLGEQIDDMVNDLSGYSRFGVSDHNDYAYQHQDIFYKTAMFHLIDSGKFWLAPGGPSAPPADTRPWDNYYHCEVVTWGKFQDSSTGFQFFVFNAHFEPGAEVSQTESARLVLARVAEIAQTSPAVFMGDLNVDQTSGPYAILKDAEIFEDTYDLAMVTIPSFRQTFNGWKANPSGNREIDHIFVTAHWQVVSHKILRDNFNGVLPSDHFPVLSVLEVPKTIP